MAEETRTLPRGIRAVVFDAYGTLFDVTGMVSGARDALGDRTEALGRLWRQKQLEYTWLRSLMGSYADFWQVTGEALDYAMEAIGLEDPGLRARLMQQHMVPPVFADAGPCLKALRERDLKTAILSNGSTTMLTAAVNAAEWRRLLDHLISVEPAHIYKPHPTVYALAPAALAVEPLEIAFVSGNPWDVAGAAHFGFRTVWLNRAGVQSEHLPGTPALVVDSLASLPHAFES